MRKRRQRLLSLNTINVILYAVTPLVSFCVYVQWLDQNTQPENQIKVKMADSLTPWQRRMGLPATFPTENGVRVTKQFLTWLENRHFPLKKADTMWKYCQISVLNAKHFHLKIPAMITWLTPPGLPLKQDSSCLTHFLSVAIYGLLFRKCLPGLLGVFVKAWFLGLRISPPSNCFGSRGSERKSQAFPRIRHRSELIIIIIIIIIINIVKEGKH